jgi:probable rRNA maturation factor
MNIVIANRQRVKKVDLRLLKEITATILSKLKIENAEIEISLAGGKEMAEINGRFLRHEGPTDVITFDYSEKEKTENGKWKFLHGEIFICVDEAIFQAKKFRTTWQSEIVRYLVHGILHLLGHDDLKPQLRRKMKREENRLLRAIAGKFSLAQIAGRSKISA